MAFFYGGHLLGFDLFNNETLYQDYYSSLLKAAVFETMGETLNPVKLTAESALGILNKAIKKVERGVVESFPGIGVGTQTRFEADEYAGFELDNEKMLIHYSLLNKRDISRDFRYRRPRRSL